MGEDRERFEDDAVKAREVDLRALWAKYSKYWYVVVLGLVMALGIAYVVNWYTNPVFGVKAKLLLKEEDSGTQNLLEGLDIEPTARNIKNELEILKSHSLINRTLSELEFDVSYFLIGKVKQSEVYQDCPFMVEPLRLEFSAYSNPVRIEITGGSTFRIFRESGDEEFSREGTFGDTIDTPVGRLAITKRENFRGSQFEDPNYERRNYRVVFNTINQLRNKYLNKLQVQLAREESTVLELYLEDQVPRKAIDFINKIIEVYLRNDLEEKNKSTSSTKDFIDKQLEDISSELSRIEQNRESFKVKQGIINIESESKIVLEAVRNLDQELAKVNAKLGMIDYLEESVKNNKKIRDLAPSAMDMNDPLLVKLVNKLNELQSERQRMISTSSANNPRLLPLNSEIELTRETLLENIRNLRQSVERSRTEYQDELEKYRSRISNIPSTERELLEIERQFRIRESLYLYLLEKKAELSISQAATRSDKRVIDTARLLPGAVRPNPFRAYSIAVLLGLLVPVGGIVLARKLNDRIDDKGEIERLAPRLPLVGVVGVSQHPDRLVVNRDPVSPISEAFRSVRANLSFLTTADERPVIMVTSSVSTEGKTFTATNLAAIYAMSGKRTVLVGMDLRKPAIELPGEMQDPMHGVSTLLSGRSSLEDALIKSDLVEDLDLIPAGPTPPNPGELIAGTRLEKFLEDLKQKYEVVVLDTPPIGLVSDSLMLTRYASATLFVVRQKITRREHLQYLQRLHSDGKLPRTGIVYNAVKSRGGRYYGYAGYGYGYGYGSYSEGGKKAGRGR